MSLRGASIALLALPLAGALQAQAIEPERPTRHFSDAEVLAVAMPALAFEETPEDVENYEKYFYFHRPDTGFDEAFADLIECDALSSGSSYHFAGSGMNDSLTQSLINQQVMQYGLAGGVGGVIGSAIGSAVADAIYGSAERRRMRRVNMRTCMHFKDYDRYGLSKDLWKDFNFEEGNGRAEEAERNRDLLAQARVASGPLPQQEALEP